MEEILTHRHSNLVFFFLIAICIFFLTAHMSPYVRGAKNFVFYVVIPTPEAAARVVHECRGLVHNLADIVTVHQQNLVLRSRVEKYEYLHNEYLREKEENTRLRNLVNFPAPVKKRSVIARIVIREPGSWFQWVIIDKGKAHGIKTDMPVIALAGEIPAVLGRVGDVSENTSKVILVTNILSAVPAADMKSSQDGLLEGQNGPRLKLNYILKEGKVSIGDEITTSPLSSVFPPGIMIGVIEDVESRELDPFQSGIVKAAVDFNNLREAIVLMPVE